MLYVALLAALSIDRAVATDVHDHFDVVEVNHVYNEHGGVVFDQLIFWDWCRQRKRFHVEAWIMMKHARDLTDEQHRRAWEKASDSYTRRKPLNLMPTSRELKYKGKFVGGDMMPMRDFRSGDFVVWFNDNGVSRKITAEIFRETHTQYDPETKDREEHPEALRRGLMR